MILPSVTVPGSCFDAFNINKAASKVSCEAVGTPTGCGSSSSESVSVISLLLSSRFLLSSLSSFLFCLLLQTSSLASSLVSGFFLGAFGSSFFPVDVLDGVAGSGLLSILIA